MKRLSMLFALLAFLAMPAAAHDPPANEGKKQIHGIMAIAPSCEGDGCYATYFRVFHYQHARLFPQCRQNRKRRGYILQLLRCFTSQPQKDA